MALRTAYAAFVLGAVIAPYHLSAQTKPAVESIYYRESRSENSYVIERSYDAVVCRDIIQKLNRKYWIPSVLRMPYDYAEIEAHYYLGTHGNIRWEKREFQFANVAAPAEVAEIDLFNSGQASTVLRRLSSVASVLHHRLYLATLQDGRWSVTDVRIHDSRERNRRLGPELATPFSFPIMDIIASGGRHYVLFKPIESLARDRRLYVLQLYGFEPNDGGADYELLCTMVMH